MEQFAHISIDETHERLATGTVALVDIRDEQSFYAGHIAQSFHLTNGSLNQFMAETEFDTPVVVVCYHGHSSQQAAQFLLYQGFEEVYSMDGGVEAWRKHYPLTTKAEEA